MKGTEVLLEEGEGLRRLKLTKSSSCEHRYIKLFLIRFGECLLNLLKVVII